MWFRGWACLDPFDGWESSARACWHHRVVRHLNSVIVTYAMIYLCASAATKSLHMSYIDRISFRACYRHNDELATLTIVCRCHATHVVRVSPSQSSIEISEVLKHTVRQSETSGILHVMNTRVTSKTLEWVCSNLEARSNRTSRVRRHDHLCLRPTTHTSRRTQHRAVHLWDDSCWATAPGALMCH